MPVLEDMQATPAAQDKDRPFVAFDTRTVEDAAKTKETGRIHHRDQDYAIITSPGGKTNNIEKVESFFLKMEAEVQVGRIPEQWVETWKRAYAKYQAGQAIPVDGTPIRGWKLLTGAQQEELLRYNILTVESLANLTDEGMRNIGMGALEWKRRAQGWLSQNASKEEGALKVTALSRENDELKGQVASMMAKLAELEEAMKAKKKS